MKFWMVLTLAGLAALSLCGGCAGSGGNARGVRVEPYRLPDYPRPVGRWLAENGEGTTTAGGRLTQADADATAITSRPWGHQTPDGTRRRLQRGDRIVVYLRPRGHGESQKIEDVLEDTGTITLPYIGPTRITGMSPSEAESFIKRRYIEDEIFQEPDVTVLAQEEEFFVTGEVQRPGKYGYSRSLTLLQAIAEAGGYNPFANASRITVRRGDRNINYNASRIKGGRDPDPAILPGDVIIVPERFY